ncbi:hypothetical protein PSTG_09160 [Puccinia striiformis f. sp. tritici PST-78]|uniref:CxC1-like cysteine cluster associated with KDZ transposases domain-containing protein n=1 Tax=Puccinia striiformis f. sp. tritici PST-78 TaxID=1165861 RepID=A0A0L0VEJ4_9BASI|nr:hypothetical protein PSTG_09160 [Puccinia striiformis f. sp. tritici PST-78]
MSRFFGYIILRRFLWFIVFVLFAGELDIEAKRTYLKDPRPTLAQKLRRTQNAAINLSARARLQANHLDQPDQSDQLSQDVQVSDMDMANNPYDPHQQNQEDGNTSDEGEVEPVQWITLAADDNEQADTIDPAIHLAQEQYRQLMKEYNWACLLRSLHSWYMTLKLHTQNWSAPNALDEFISTDCKCPPSKKKTQYVDLIDTHGQRRTQVSFCACAHDAIRLLKLGYLAGSPVTPQTAFSLPLLILFNCLWNNCHIGMQPFTTALTEYLEPRSERLFVENANHARDVRKPFSAAVDMFRRLEEMSDDLLDSALQLTDLNILAGPSCPACFGPQPANLSACPAATRNPLCICLDGNFQHRHHSKASRDHETLQMPHIFLPEGAVEAMTTGIRHLELVKKPPAQADRCADAHKAADDKRNESTWKGCDDTGLMGCCCRHDSAISLTNIYKSGEQRAMPLALLRKLLGSVEEAGLLPEFANQLTFGTSIFHSYVHNWMCQLDYNPRLNTGWGLSDGEGLERMWLYLSPLVSPLRYATRNHRLAAIAHRLKYHNTRGIKQLPHWLSKKFKMATRRHWETRAQLDFLLSKQNPFKPQGRNYQPPLKKLRQKLLDPKLALLPVKAMKKIIKSIKQRSRQLKKDAEGISDLPPDEENHDEQRLRLLLWNMKQQLYIQAVQLRAERQPLMDANKTGPRVGTDRKEEIFKAMRKLKPASKNLLNKYNKLYSEFAKKCPTHPAAKSPLHPVDYNNFSKWPLDHEFWNDGLYFQTTAPWAIEPDVRSGISCVLTLSRIHEEFQLIAQELARSVGWALDYYNNCKNKIQVLNRRIDMLAEQPDDVELDHFDNLAIHGLPRRIKLKMIQKELRQRRALHTILVVEEWDKHVLWLVNHCQPAAYRSMMLSDWQKMKDEMVFEEAGGMADRVNVDTALEDSVLDVALDDGEDVDENQMDNAEDGNTDANEMIQMLPDDELGVVDACHNDNHDNHDDDDDDDDSDDSDDNDSDDSDDDDDESADDDDADHTDDDSEDEDDDMEGVALA